MQPQNDNPAYTLPEEPKQALFALTKVTEGLLDIAERESQALATADMLTFAVIQNEKEVISLRYSKMAQQFSKRIEEFRGSDKALLDKLDRLQEELRKKAQMNNDVVRKIAKKQHQKTNATLVTAQELAQEKAVHFTRKDPRTGEIYIEQVTSS